MASLSLFEDLPEQQRSAEAVAPGAVLLHGFALPVVPLLLQALAKIEALAPYRNMVTPGGFRMSVAMSNCGAAGWVTDNSGYRYTPCDPLTGSPWPVMPESFADLATEAAQMAGFSGFAPDACLINRYEPGARMTLHQDKNERDFNAPIVSVSLGLPAVFLFGGLQRSDRPSRIPLVHGDVVVWGGPARLRFHGVMPLKPGNHAILGQQRVNLTFRKSL